jgi:YD repeat-containing protein
MKKISLSASCLCAIVVVTTFSRCEKSGGTATTSDTTTTRTTTTSTPAQTCQITGFSQAATSQTSAQTYTLGYDNQNRLTSWHLSYTASNGTPENQSEAFQYGAGYVLTTWVTAITTNDSLVLNSDGSISADYFSDKLSTGLTKYTYSSNGELLTSVAASSTNSTIKTTVYTWSNGDMVATSNEGAFSYDSTKKSVQGDETQLTQLLQYGTGAWTTKVAHQLTSENIGFAVQYAYAYDSAGKVTSLTTQAAGVPTTTQIFTYDCH